MMCRYPTCLVYLTLLQQPLFRERLKDPLFAPELVRIGTRHHETWSVSIFFVTTSANSGRRTEGMKESIKPQNRD